jgi:hypothetical protein
MINLLLPLLLAMPVAEEPRCGMCNIDGDQNGLVDVKDLQIFLTNFDGVVDESPSPADLNCDGEETIADYLMFLTYFGRKAPECKNPE